MLNEMIQVAQGAKKADLVLKNARYVSVLTGEILQEDIAIHQGFIAGMGRYEGVLEVDASEGIYMPGFIDAHVHVESSMVSPGEYARAVVPRGTTTVVADPHEIANVLGLKGIQMMLDDAAQSPLDMKVMLPSCVPATPFESSGAVLTHTDLLTMADHADVLGLGEMMNYPGVLNGEEGVLDKLTAFKGKLIDGHCPHVTGLELNAYIAAGIRTDHESTDLEEMLEKLRKGMYVLIREGSAAKDLMALLPGIQPNQLRRILFCTDDRQPTDLLLQGHIDHMVRTAIHYGVSPIHAIQIATLNAAEGYRLYDRGILAPGYLADIICVNDLETLKIEKVYKRGELVGEKGVALFKHASTFKDQTINSVTIGALDAGMLHLPLTTDIARVIRIEEGSLLTKQVVRKVHLEEGVFKVHPNLDILKLVVLERHHGTGRIGLGLVENFNLQGGALATSVAHDSHNLIAVGDRDEDILLALGALKEMMGGLVVVGGGKILAALPLPIGGLMSDCDIETVHSQLKDIEAAVHSLGVSKTMDAFMQLAFLALPVIPELKLTDRGLFDVKKFQFTTVDIQELFS
jgi:adenine deaminase